MKIIATISLLIFATKSAFSAGIPPTWHPRDYCSIGAEVGYTTRPFNAMGVCASNMVDIGKTPGRNGMLNNLAFYSVSDTVQPTKLQRVSLILNVNNAAETIAAREYLVRAATAVSKKILGAEPAGFASAIRAGNRAAWTNSEWRTEVVYTDWPTKLGHDISVRFIATN